MQLRLHHLRYHRPPSRDYTGPSNKLVREQFCSMARKKSLNKVPHWRPAGRWMVPMPLKKMHRIFELASVQTQRCLWGCIGQTCLQLLESTWVALCTMSNIPKKSHDMFSMVFEVHISKQPAIPILGMLTYITAFPLSTWTKRMLKMKNFVRIRFIVLGQGNERETRCAWSMCKVQK